MTKRKQIKINPLDATGIEIILPEHLDHPLAMMASRRVQRLWQHAKFHKLSDIVEAAYLQGMSDMAHAVLSEQEQPDDKK